VEEEEGDLRRAIKEELLRANLISKGSFLFMGVE